MRFTFLQINSPGFSYPRKSALFLRLTAQIAVFGFRVIFLTLSLCFRLLLRFIFPKKYGILMLENKGD